MSLAPGVRLGVYETLRERIARRPTPLDEIRSLFVLAAHGLDWTEELPRP